MVKTQTDIKISVEYNGSETHDFVSPKLPNWTLFNMLQRPLNLFIQDDRPFVNFIFLQEETDTSADQQPPCWQHFFMNHVTMMKVCNDESWSVGCGAESAVLLHA